MGRPMTPGEAEARAHVAAARATDPTYDLAVEVDRVLLARMVRDCGTNSTLRAPRWSHVGDVLGHGSGVSAAICTALGVDPHELVGGTAAQRRRDHMARLIRLAPPDPTPPAAPPPERPPGTDP